ncbi:MAG: ABC transporter permease [Bacteroidota bacterium]
MPFLRLPGEADMNPTKLHTPPRWLLTLFRWFCHPEYVEDIEGDLTERFHLLVEESGMRKAQFRFLWEILRLIRPSLIKPLFPNHFIQPAMLKHNLLITYRSFLRNKSSFLINLIGLSTGLACVILILLWIQDEWNYDKFHENDARLYQVMEHQDFDGLIHTAHETSGPTAEKLLTDFPQIEYATTVIPSNWYDFNRLTVSVGEKRTIAAGQYVGKDYFNIFSFPLLEGDKDMVLEDKNGMVISRSLAERLFNTSRGVIGKEVRLQQERNFIITGVFEDVSPNSSLQFDFAMSVELYKDIAPWIKEWNGGPLTYVTVQKGTDVEALNQEVSQLMLSIDENTNRRPFLRPFSEAYLYAKYENGKVVGGRIEYVRLFSLVALFILLIACINFMNLTTAKASIRFKEIGIKKTVGASRVSLMSQYLGESIILSVLGLVLAFILVLVFLPEFNQITRKQLRFPSEPLTLVSIIGIAIGTGILAGSYPALYLSNLNIIQTIKGRLKTSFGALWLRRGLVVFQFTLSFILIVAVWVVYQQMSYVQTQNIGYDREQVIIFDIQGKVKENPDVFLEELKRQKGVINSAVTSHDLSGISWTSWGGIRWEGMAEDDNRKIELAGVGFGFLETMGIELASGRSFSREYRSDSVDLMFNEAAISMMGYTPEEAVGKPIDIWGNTRKIIGVTKNFHFESLHEEVKPMVFFHMGTGALKYVVARLVNGQEQETLTHLSSFYEEINPGFSLDYKFMDEDYQAFYEAEQRVADLSGYFTFLAILISCLGILGLAAFTAERRTKEIGIRKILGATPWRIINLLSKDFSKMVLVAILIGLPASYFLAREWLNGFAYKIDLTYGYFLGATILTFLIAWSTVSLQSLRAASINPVDCLKDE